MNERNEGILSIIAALFVLFSAMLDPRISAALAVILLAVFALYKLMHKRGAKE